MTFRDLTAFFSFLTGENLVFQIFLLRSIIAYLCPNIINFDIVHFSERRPEEVISFFWRSVYDSHHQKLSLLKLIEQYLDSSIIRRWGREKWSVPKNRTFHLWSLLILSSVLEPRSPCDPKDCAWVAFNLYDTHSLSWCTETFVWSMQKLIGHEFLSTRTDLILFTMGSMFGWCTLVVVLLGLSPVYEIWWRQSGIFLELYCLAITGWTSFDEAKSYR